MAIVTKGVRPASELVTGKPPEWLSTWAEFASKTEFENLPAAVVNRTCLVILDSIGAILAGRAEREIAVAERRLRETARIGPRGSPLITAFIDGTAGTTLEIDEGNQYARGHPGIHVVPAVLAASAAGGVDGKSVIAAIVLGYEIGARIGAASKLKVAMHPHGTWGTTGAAVSIAKVHGASAGAFASVINVSSSLALATSRRTMLEGGTVRNTYAGFSNMIGMMAWDLVAAGFTGESDGIGSVYDGIVADGFDALAMTHELGRRWEIARNYFKRHAACRYNHGALDALAGIVTRNGGRIAPESIEAIDVQTYVWAAQLDHAEPPNMLAAKFSMPFSLATFIVNGSATLDAFRDDARDDARTRALAQKIRVGEDPAMTARLPAERPARVRVHLRDGRILEGAATVNKGDTEDPYSRDEVIEKFYEVTGLAVERSRAREIIDVVFALPAEADLIRLHALLGRQP
jgi:2-methylcitrate dehydratase PrpD